MNAGRIVRIARPSLALAAMAVALVIVGGLVAGPAGAATTASPTPSVYSAPLDTQGTIVRAGEDVVVPAGQRVDGVVAFGGDVTVLGGVKDTVVAFGGNVTIDGSVDGAVVAFGGDVTVAGTVGANIVAFGGDVRLTPTAVVGTSMSPQDETVIVFGGALSRDAGAQVTGTVQRYEGADWSKVAGWLANADLVQQWWGFSLFGWLVQTAIFLVLALVAAALMPRQLRAVQRKLAEKPAASLGWGALTLFIITPAVLVVLIISIVGLLLVLPYFVVVPLFYFFVITAVAAFVTERLLAGTSQKDNLMLAVTLGVIGTTIVSRVPVAGALTLLVMAVFGAGAAAMALVDWRRVRKLAATPAHPLGPAPAVPPAAWPGGVPPLAPAYGEGVAAVAPTAEAAAVAGIAPAAVAPADVAGDATALTAETTAAVPEAGAAAAATATAATAVAPETPAEMPGAEDQTAATAVGLASSAEAALPESPAETSPAESPAAESQPEAEAPPAAT